MQNRFLFRVNTVRILNYFIDFIPKIYKKEQFIIYWANHHNSNSPSPIVLQSFLLQNCSCSVNFSASHYSLQFFRRKMSKKIDTFKDDGTKSSNSITETEDLSTSPKTGNLSKIPKTEPELLRHDLEDTITDKTEVKEKEIESNNETDDQKTKNVDSNIVIGDLTASPQADTSNPVTASISELSKNDPELSHDEEKSEENTSNNETDYEKIKEVFLTMDTEKKRKLYRCSKYLTLDRIKTWPEYHSDNRYQIEKKCTVKRDPDLKFKDFNEGLNKKISLIQDDITSLEVDAIVNAANKTLLGGGGVDGAIHRAAGENLLAECKRLNGCDTGEAKITGGYKLPAKYVIHTVGPVGEKSSKLKNCYFNSLNLLREHNLKSIAFPCISTGIYGYPNKSAAKVALETVREWLELNDNAENVERIIFCCFLQKDIDIYHAYLPVFFPLSPPATPTPSTSVAENVEPIEKKMESEKDKTVEKSWKIMTNLTFAELGKESKKQKQLAKKF